MVDAITTWLAAATVNQTAGNFIAGMLLALFSVTSVWLGTSLSPAIRLTGFICGLLSQPAWFYIAITSHNLGLFINSIFFSTLWLYRSIPAYHNRRKI